MSIKQEIVIKDDEENQKFGRYGFLFTLLGYAVGISNVWRFPNKLVTYGGGTQLIVQMIALLTVIMPIQGLELILGIKQKKGASIAFGSMQPGFSGLGLAGVFIQLMIYAEQSTLLGQILKMIVESIIDPTQFNKSEFLMDKIVKNSVDNDKYTINQDNLAYTAITMLICQLATCKGPKQLSYFVQLSFPIPVILLIVLAIRGFMLKGALSGIYVQLMGGNGYFDQKILSDVFGQCFFSLGVGTGVITAYASFNRSNKDSILIDEKIICLTDMMIAFISGFSIQSYLGNQVQNCKLIGLDPNECEAIYQTAGFELAFKLLPTCLNEIGGQQVVILMITLQLLGIDSCLSMLDGVKMGVMDQKQAHRIFSSNQENCGIAISILALILAIPCNMKQGQIIWNCWEKQLYNWGLLIIAFLEIISVSFFQKRSEKENNVGQSICNIIDYGLIFGMIISSFGFVLIDIHFQYYNFDFNASREVNNQKYQFCLTPNGYDSLKNEVNSWTEPRDYSYLFCGWQNPNAMNTTTGYMLKQFTPTCLCLVFAQNTKSLMKDFKSNYLDVEIQGYIILFIIFTLIIIQIFNVFDTVDQIKILPDSNERSKHQLQNEDDNSIKN